MLRNLLTLACAIFLSGIALNAQTVDEIIAKNVQAHGGMEKLKAVQTLRNGRIRSARNKSFKGSRQFRPTTAKLAGR
jgi:hypothetical protein